MLLPLSPNFTFRAAVCRSVSLATEEMTRQFDIVDEVQLPCSKILVRFGSRNHNVQKVMETLLLKFQPGSPSHYYVITTLSDLATCNPTHVVPFLKTILTTMMANMKATKKDYLRYLRLSTYVFSLLSKAYPWFNWNYLLLHNLLEWKDQYLSLFFYMSILETLSNYLSISFEKYSTKSR